MVNGKREKQAEVGRSGLELPASASGSPGRNLRASGRRPGCPSGFTLLEVLIVVTFIAIILMMAIPSLYVLAPNYMVRSSAAGLEMLMQKARLTANNTQKPMRVVVDCRSASQLSNTSSCLMAMYSPKLNNLGELDPSEPWIVVLDSRREVNRKVRVGIPNISGDPRPTPAPVYTNIADVYWAVFMPTGRVHVSHDPMRLSFSSTESRTDAREVSLNKYSGRATVRVLK